jgi:regulation of enolase protein 1 (concanavalin A-like superfamily)
MRLQARDPIFERGHFCQDMGRGPTFAPTTDPPRAVQPERFMTPSFNGAARLCGSLLLACATQALVTTARAQSLSGWQNADIGNVAAAGGATATSTDAWTLSGSGADIWDNADEFQYAYQPWSGDGEFIVRVTGITATDGWAKAGVMIRESLTPGSRHALACVNPQFTPAGVFRTTTGGASTFAAPYQKFSPMWLKLVRVNSAFTVYYSSDGASWQKAVAQTIDLPANVYVGLAVTSHRDGVLCTANFDHLSFRSTSNPAPTAPANLTATATGTSVALHWNDNSSNETRFQIERSTDGVNFSFDGFVGANVTDYTSNYLNAYTTYYFRVRSEVNDATFAYSNTAVVATGAAALGAPGLTAAASSSQQIDLHWTDGYTGETGFEVYRSVDNTNFTLLTTTPPDTAQFSVNGLTAATWYYFRVRAMTSGGASPYSDTAVAQTQSGPPTPPSGPAAPTALSATGGAGRIDLSWMDNATDETGFHFERSVDNVNFVALATLAADTTRYADTAVESGKTYYYRVRAVAGLAASAYTNVASALAGAATTTSSASASVAWSAADIGAVGVSGSGTVSGTDATVIGAGADIWDSSDAFRYVYRPWTGDGQIVVRVDGVSSTHPWSKAGVMFRETLSTNSPNLFAYLTPSNGVGFQARGTAGGATNFTGGPWWVSAPYWLKLTRSGNTFTAHTSADGISWIAIGSASVPMASSIYVGLAVTSHTTAQTNTAKFSQLDIH